MKITFRTVGPEGIVFIVTPGQDKTLATELTPQGELGEGEEIDLNVLRLSGAPFSSFFLTVLENPSVFNEEFPKPREHE